MKAQAQYTIHSNSYLTVTGLVKWALNSDDTSLTQESRYKAARLLKLASTIPDLPARVLLEMVDGQAHVDYYPNSNWQQDRVEVKATPSWEEDDETSFVCQVEEQDLSALRLPKRIVNLLTNAGIRSVEQLLRHTVDDLLDIPRLGPSAVDLIRLALAETWGTDLRKANLKSRRK